FRKKGVISRTVILKSAAAASIIFGVFGLVGYMTKGYEPILLAGLSDTQRTIYKGEQGLAISGKNRDCHFRSASFNVQTASRFNECYSQHGKAIVILGDSHGGNVHRAITYHTDHPFI